MNNYPLEFTETEIKSLPLYVSVGGSLESGKGVAMRLVYRDEHRSDFFREYYRDAGNWSCDIHLDKLTGKVYSISPDIKGIHEVEVIPITKEQWQKDNSGYITNKTKAAEWEEKEYVI